MAAKSTNTRLKLTQIIFRVDTIIYNAHSEHSDRYPHRRAPDKEYVSFTRTLKRLCEEGYVQKEGRYYILTNEGVGKVAAIKEEIRKLREELNELELFARPS